MVEEIVCWYLRVMAKYQEEWQNISICLRLIKEKEVENHGRWKILWLIIIFLMNVDKEHMLEYQGYSFC